METYALLRHPNLPYAYSVSVYKPGTERPRTYILRDHFDEPVSALDASSLEDAVNLFLTDRPGWVATYTDLV
jgi:hypothetical protein